MSQTPLADHNAAVLAEAQEEAEHKKFLSTLQRVTLPELEWQELGFHRMTEDQQIAWLMQKMAKSVSGAAELNGVQAKLAHALLNKLRADKKAVEVTHNNLAQELTDAELDERIARHLEAATEKRTTGVAVGTGAPRQSAKAH